MKRMHTSYESYLIRQVGERLWVNGKRSHVPRILIDDQSCQSDWVPRTILYHLTPESLGVNRFRILRFNIRSLCRSRLCVRYKNTSVVSRYNPLNYQASYYMLKNQALFLGVTLTLILGFCQRVCIFDSPCQSKCLSTSSRSQLKCNFARVVRSSIHPRLSKLALAGDRQNFAPSLPSSETASWTERERLRCIKLVSVIFAEPSLRLENFWILEIRRI